MKVVQIGCSGHYYSFHKALADRTDIEYVGYARGVQEEDSEHFIRTFQKQLGFEVYEDYIDMLDKTKPDIAIVNSFFHLNAKISTEILERGVNVYSEKPVATTVDDLELLKKAYQNNDVHFSAMLEIRSEPYFMAAYKAIREGQQEIFKNKVKY